MLLVEEDAFPRIATKPCVRPDPVILSRFWDTLRTSAKIDVLYLCNGSQRNRFRGKPIMELAFWRDLSVIWLSLFCFIGLALPLAGLYFAVRGMNALHDRTYRLVRRTQQLSSQLPAQTEQVAAKVAAPVIRAEAHAKRIETFVQSLFPGK